MLLVETNVPKSWAPGLLGYYILYCGHECLWILSMKFASYHASGVLNFGILTWLLDFLKLRGHPVGGNSVLLQTIPFRTPRTTEHYDSQGCNDYK